MKTEGIKRSRKTDNTETYIKMRIAAIPDIGYGEPLEETFRSEQHYVVENDEYAVFISPDGNWYVFHPDIPSNGEQGRTLQLERQDQLQEMVRGGQTVWQLIQRFWNWLWTKEEIVSDKSMEQIWLAFVMKEKYNKAWSGTEWS